MKNKKPELVCPAGEWGDMVTALDSGADSVYFGIKGINMRARAVNFDILQLPKVMDYIHQRNKKGYLTVNTIVMEHELDKVEKILRAAKDAGVDGIILWDLAVMAMAKELGLPFHLSTQASVANSRALAFYSQLGVKRVVLARECTLEDIATVRREISEKNIPCEIEAFAHGAMCVSVSGRCFLSTYSFAKSANQGECKQPCRREFVIKDVKDETEYVLGSDYVLSPKDLCTIDFIDQLIETGVNALKIEGRMRSTEYIKIVVSAYRRAIDAYFEGKLTAQLKDELKEQVTQVYNRQFSEGFYFGRPQAWVSESYEKGYEKVFIGDVVNYYQRVGVAEVAIRSGELKSGDRILVTGKTTPATFADALELQQEHKVVTSVKKGEAVGIKLPFKVRRNDQVFLWKKSG